MLFFRRDASIPLLISQTGMPNAALLCLYPFAVLCCRGCSASMGWAMTVSVVFPLRDVAICNGGVGMLRRERSWGSSGGSVSRMAVGKHAPGRERLLDSWPAKHQGMHVAITAFRLSDMQGNGGKTWRIAPSCRGAQDDANCQFGPCGLAPLC